MAIPLGLSPLSFVIAIAAIISIAFSLVYKFFTDQPTMRELKKDIKKYQAQMKENRGDTEKLKELQKKAMSTNIQYMKHSMKPLLITTIPILFVFRWIGKVLGGIVILTLPIWPGQVGWIASYIFFSLIFTMTFRKVLKLA